MPIVERIDRLNGVFYMRADWKLCRVIWPKQCLISNKRLWPGTWAYRGRAVWHGPGEPELEEHWHDCQEHLIWQLKE
jgi:hypothetical protein